MSEDDQLIAECLGGRSEAFDELVRRCEPRLRKLVRAILQNDEDARDALQDAFLQAYAALHRFKGGSDFFTWLYRIAFNAAIDLKRKHHRAEVSMQAILPEGMRLDVTDPADYNPPHAALEAAEEKAQLYQALGRLPSKDRALLILRDIEGRKYEELAQRLKLPLGTISSRLHRARAKLRKLLLNGSAHRDGLR
jgi:RNA polymerase sigma-70 factor (ECF subfamily)